MPIIIDKNLPAHDVLTSENIFVMTEERANTQDIRPLRILIVNLMPTKITTETQLLRLIGNTPLQVNVDFLYTESHRPKNVSEEHLVSFYKTFSEIREKRYDGMIVTGAPVESLDFEQVSYWEELKEILEFSKTNVTSNLYICWGAQAGIYYHFGIQKHPIEKKAFGVFQHETLIKNLPLLRGFDDLFFAPHSRYTEVKAEDIANCEGLTLLSISPEVGVHLAASSDGKHIFQFGHSEYDKETLKSEYERDINNDINIHVPKNYFRDNDPNNDVLCTWKSHGNLLFYNWLNYYVYQETPYNL
jgi:homoserine O-succinyltransferase